MDEVSGVAFVQETVDAVLDSSGAAFNPDIHTSKDGNPVVNKNGTFRKRKFRRHAEISEDDSPDDCAATSAVVTETFFSICMMFGGTEWQPEETEHTAMASAWENYLRAKGIDTIPPEAMLVMAVGAYAGKRFAKPSVGTKAKRWISSKTSRWFGVRNNAFPNSGNHDLREDHDSKPTS